MALAEFKSLEALVNEAAALTKEVRQAIVESGIGVPNAEGKVLQLLEEHGPLPVPHLARLRNTTRQNIQIIVNRLMKESYVELLPNPAHKRSSLVCLTENGRSLPSQSRAAESAILEKFTGLFPAQEVHASTDLLAALRLKLCQPPIPERRKHKPSPKLPSTHQPIDYEMPVSLL